jgi:hypothetical protein
LALFCVSGRSAGMGLERWDPRRGKYVLYQSREQHSDDCARFPFESIPRRVFLDTNVINVLVKHSTHVFDHEPIPLNTEPTLAIDIEALMHVFYVSRRADWDLLGSPKTIDELMRTKDGALRGDLVEYASGLVSQDLSREERRFAIDFGRRLVDTPFVGALPDAADRELIGNAIGFGCDAFCTCDRATIVRKRSGLRKVPLRIMTPAEWWAHIKPWAGLWC